MSETTQLALNEPSRDRSSESLLLLLPRFLMQESEFFNGKLVLLTLLGGIAHGLLLVFVLEGLQTPTNSMESIRLVVMFILSLVLYVIVKLHATNKTGATVEGMVRRVRVQIADKIRKAELVDFERVGSTRYTAVLAGEMQMIVEASRQCVAAGLSFWMILGGMIYIATISQTAAMLTAATFFGGIMVFYQRNRALEKVIMDGAAADGVFFDRLRDLSDGFKELKLNANKSDDLFENYIVRSAELAEQAKIKLCTFLNRNMITVQCFHHTLVGTAVFVMPSLLKLDSMKQMILLQVLIFLFGPVFEVVGAMEVSVRASGSVLNLRQLERDLERIANVPREPRDPVDVFGPFEELTLSNLTFRYENRGNERAFSIKPVNLTVRKGETIFLIGGNGSGKSTLINLLCGLHLPNSGEIQINGQTIGQDNLTAYRGLFGIVLQDYHLFGRLYGNPTPNLEEAKRLLKQLNLAAKTSLGADGAFSTIDLSGGQRKRLAMVIARLEDPQIFVFDEWAADQDPAYKKFFYQEMLPEMAAMGKTIIVVSHDDRYFPPDHRGVYKMEDGELCPYEGSLIGVPAE